MSLEKAIAYANEREGTEGYGNNGCTEWVRQFLLKMEHPLGELMTSGEAGNLMWVPDLMDWAKENGLWKEPEEGGACGDVCLLETNDDFGDGADHVVIADGKGGYWGNSSSRNQIVHRDIAHDYGADHVWGYIATGEGGGTVSVGECGRSMAEIVGDAGSTSGNVADFDDEQEPDSANFGSYETVSTKIDRYNTPEELPEWAKQTVQKLVMRGALSGNGQGLDLSLDMIRMLVINDRAGVYN